MNRARLGAFMRRTFWASLLGAGVSLCLCACDYSKYERGYAISNKSLREAGTLDLADASTTRPTTRPATTTTPSTRPAEELVAPPPPAEAKLTIDECRILALANNLDLKVELFNPTIARESISEERARFETLFTASANYNITDQAT